MKHPHLAESQMSYWTHLTHSVRQSWSLLVIAFKSIVHGVFPSVWVNSGPLGVYQIYKEIKKFEHVRKVFKNNDQ
jgi:hypothetical protein